MIDLDCFLQSLKAVWASRIQNCNSKWANTFKEYASKIFINPDYIWKTSFRTIESFPIIKLLPKFYQQVVIAFNKAKYIKPFRLLNKYEIMQQPLWGNEYFKAGATCIFLKAWIKEISCIPKI